jgi:hypothetical protein
MQPAPLLAPLMLPAAASDEILSKFHLNIV